jgi:hypothetical protein
VDITNVKIKERHCWWGGGRRSAKVLKVHVFGCKSANMEGLAKKGMVLAK